MNQPRDSYVVGIDPGLTGAVAFLQPSSGALRVFDMPTYKIRGRNRIIVPTLRKCFDSHLRIEHVFIEDVHSLPRDAGRAAFAFGRALGVVEGVIGGLALPMTPVTPQKWKRDMQVPADKASAIARACQLLPEHVALWTTKRNGGECPTVAAASGRAEAAMIALWGIRHSGLQG